MLVGGHEGFLEDGTSESRDEETVPGRGELHEHSGLG